MSVDVDDHVARRAVDRQTRADCRRYWFFNEIHRTRADKFRRSAHRTFFTHESY